jgi:hypothetical protein
MLIEFYAFVVLSILLFIASNYTMSYTIRPYTKRRAKDLGVEVQPSKKSGKKIDVLRDGKIIASVGHLGMGDYPTYMATHDREFAEERRRLYKRRHERHRTIKNTPSYWADQLLW